MSGFRGACGQAACTAPCCSSRRAATTSVWTSCWRTGGNTSTARSRQLSWIALTSTCCCPRSFRKLDQSSRTQWRGASSEGQFVMVLDGFRSCVARMPEAIAVQDGDLRLTYRQLAGHASGLAAGLTRRGVARDDVVAVYANRSAELVVAELAVLLAGAAYLPLDPAHPATRISELIALSGAVVVVSTGPLMSDDALHGHDLEVVDLTELPAEPLTAPATLADATLAYVIFTSGSTGRPKGVAVSHGNLANLMRWRQKAYPLGPRDRAMLMSSPGFDASVWDTWAILAVGGTLVIPPAEVRSSAPALVSWLTDEQITSTLLPTPL